MRLGITLVVVGISVYFGFKVYAGFELTSRLSELSHDAKGACMTRGAAPTPETMEQKFRAMADERGLRVRAVQVTTEPLEEAKNHPGLEGQVQIQLQKMSDGKLQMGGTLLRLTADVYGEKMLWDEQRDITASCVVGRTLRRQVPLPPQ